MTAIGTIKPFRSFRISLPATVRGDFSTGPSSEAKVIAEGPLLPVGSHLIQKTAEGHINLIHETNTRTKKQRLLACVREKLPSSIPDGFLRDTYYPISPDGRDFLLQPTVRVESTIMPEIKSDMHNGQLILDFVQKALQSKQV